MVRAVQEERKLGCLFRRLARACPPGPAAHQGAGSGARQGALPGDPAWACLPGRCQEHASRLTPTGQELPRKPQQGWRGGATRLLLTPGRMHRPRPPYLIPAPLPRRAALPLSVLLPTTGSSVHT